MSDIPLHKWAIGGIMLTTITVGLIGFITIGIDMHGVTHNVDTGELSELEKMQNSTSLTTTAQERSEEVEARSEFFSLPGVINTLRTVFQSIPIWQTFIGVSIDALNLNYATQNWPQILGLSALIIAVSYRFVKIIR